MGRANPRIVGFCTRRMTKSSVVPARGRLPPPDMSEFRTRPASLEVEHSYRYEIRAFKEKAYHNFWESDSTLGYWCWCSPGYRSKAFWGERITMYCHGYWTEPGLTSGRDEEASFQKSNLPHSANNVSYRSRPIVDWFLSRHLAQFTTFFTE